MFVKITALLFSVCVVAVLVVALSSISGAPCADALSINTGLNTANEVAKTAGTMYFLTDCTLIILVFLLIFSMLISIAKRVYHQINKILKIIYINFIILVFLLSFAIHIRIAKRNYNQINTILKIIYNILRDIT